MSTRFTLSDADYNQPSIGFDGGDLTLAATPAADSVVVEVGDNLWVGTQFRHQIVRALEQMVDKLREAQWPQGAVNYASIAGIDTPKGQIDVGSGANAPAITEDGIRIAYNWPVSGAGADSGGTNVTGTGGQGSSVNRAAAIGLIQTEILELLSTTAVAPP